MSRSEFEATLAARGLGDASLSIAHSATITPRTLAQRGVADSEATRAAVGGAQSAVDPDALPRIRLGGPDRGDSAPGSSAPDLEVVALLGEGGMGRVHLAKQRSLRREVAIKTTRDTADREAAAALCAEGVTAGHLEHPNILPVHALGRDDGGRPLLVMKRIEGVTWQELIDDPVHPAWARLLPRGGDRLDFTVRLLIQVCNALSFAHSRGVVHRDLKPENVMIGDFGEVYVLDWGLAAPEGYGRDRTEPLPLVGTPSYMAPEMLRGEPVRPATDVYLLGGLLHAALTGEPRHIGDSIHQVLFAAFESRPVDYSSLTSEQEIPEELATLANRATDPNPENRPPSAQALRTALESYLEHRASVRLSRSADLRFADARATVGTESVPSESAARTALYRAVRECNFAYRQALEQWPDNAQAREGLARCVSMAVQIELADGHPSAARTALAEHPAPTESLRAAVAQAERLEAAREAEHARLRSFAAGLDPTVGRRLRLGLALALLALALVVTIFALSTSSERALTYTDVLRFGGAVSGAMFLSVALVWRFTQGLNRRLAKWMLVLGTGLLLNRVYGVHAEVPIPYILASDSVVIATGLGAAAVSIMRSLGPSALLMASASVACTLWPEHAPWFFSIGDMMSIALIVLLWHHDERDADA